MFAKPKSPAFLSRPATPRGAGLDLRAKADKVIEFFKKPYVAPLTAGSAFILVVIAFLNLAGDPDAASQSVRIKMPKTTAAKAPPPRSGAGEAAEGETFTLDSLGLFGDTPVEGFNLDPAAEAEPGHAVITLPGDETATAAEAGPRAARIPLAQSPIAGLVQTTNSGPLPMISPAGLTPASAYARPFRSDGRPYVALIVGGLGLNPTATRQAIDQLPPEVTLSFVPYTQGLQGWIDLARASGHEVIVEVPMQPTNYPDTDPGPQTLMANAKSDELQNKLAWSLSRATGFFAVSNYQGSAFLKDKAGAQTFMSVLKSRGVAFIDDGQARGLQGAWSRASADRVIDSQINAQAIQAQLIGLETTAKNRGSALGTGFGYPVTLAVALRWTQSLEAKGIQLAPASALLHQ
ncbi:divergent polysaccharide deacetylase family protein [Asticcacaulis biprosthecium C19]|uniref:Divergent polysaccharide deacetylase family protein n=1 Tax=Asticcacaulis biprosthecium C19 TaxID=715226 RepID=F4QLC4_9CAUL|nr:divergent polysaccharide deacetylase family protein [Asticcacaulis biprosthecium]EGF92269.1 divergent polysaccharide deacetylase family protein [Asticcacaulis biprosthecium C19]